MCFWHTNPKHSEYMNVKYPISCERIDIIRIRSCELTRAISSREMGVKQTYESDKSLKNSFSWVVEVEE